jgi:Activator of Hsp90 ATPase homolog 1-like protein
MTDRIERELELPASPDEVWQAVTDPAWLALWLADEVTLELTPGGEARFRIGAEVRSGWVEEISPPDPAAAAGRGSGWLAFWWAHDEEPASRVELSLIPIERERTLLRVVETRPLEILDLVGVPLPGLGGATYGPALVAA